MAELDGDRGEIQHGGVVQRRAAQVDVPVERVQPEQAEEPRGRRRHLVRVGAGERSAHSLGPAGGARRVRPSAHPAVRTPGRPFGSPAPSSTSGRKPGDVPHGEPGGGLASAPPEPVPASAVSANLSCATNALAPSQSGCTRPPRRPDASSPARCRARSARRRSRAPAGRRRWAARRRGCRPGAAPGRPGPGRTGRRPRPARRSSPLGRQARPGRSAPEPAAAMFHIPILFTSFNLERVICQNNSSVKPALHAR